MTSNLLAAARKPSGAGFPCFTSGSSPRTMWCISEKSSRCLCVFRSKCRVCVLHIIKDTKQIRYGKKIKKETENAICNLNVVVLWWWCRNRYPVATQIGIPFPWRCLRSRLAPASEKEIMSPKVIYIYIYPVVFNQWTQPEKNLSLC